MTAYLVLRKRMPEANVGHSAGGVLGWTEVGEFKAASADGAVKTCAVKNGKGLYVAVPARSWKPRKVTVVEQVTEVKFE